MTKTNTTTKPQLHTQFITGRRSELTKMSKREDLYQTALIFAHVDADMYQLPQTIWLTNDREAPYTRPANGSEFGPELRAKPVVTILPANYFQ